MENTNRKKENIAVTIALVVIAIFFIMAIFVFGFFDTGAVVGELGETNTREASDESTMNDITTASGLIIRNIEEGEGIPAEDGMVLTVHYRGQFEDGTVFDSSYERGEPFQFILGAGQVIKGWDEGLSGMRVGGSRTLVIPSDLGYGDRDYGPIPGGSTLIFDVELLGAFEQE